MGMVFDQAHAMKTVLLNCRTVSLHACGLTKSSVLFLHHPDQSYILFLKENLLVTLLSLHNIIKLHYETF